MYGTVKLFMKCLEAGARLFLASIIWRPFGCTVRTPYNSYKCTICSVSNIYNTWFVDVSRFIGNWRVPVAQGNSWVFLQFLVFGLLQSPKIVNCGI